VCSAPVQLRLSAVVDERRPLWGETASWRPNRKAPLAGVVSGAWMTGIWPNAGDHHLINRKSGPTMCPCCAGPS